MQKRIPKLSNDIELSMLKKLSSKRTSISKYFGTSQDIKMCYRRLGNFFFKLAFKSPPLYSVNGVSKSSSTVEIIHIKDIPIEIIIGLINSTTMYWYWVLFSNVMDFKIDTISTFKFDYDLMTDSQKVYLLSSCNKLINDIDENKIIGVENRKNGELIKVARYFPQKSKPIIDEIDKVLAQHYGFTEEELDFIINYDIKYRMGKGLEAEEE